MRNFIVVGSATPLIAQVLLGIHAFTDAKCTILCSKGSARTIRYSSLCTDFVEVDLFGEEDDKFVAAVNDFVKKMPDAILVPADCEGGRITNRVRHQLNAKIIPVPNASTLDCLDNKWRFYQFCREHGLNVPPALLFHSKFELDFTLAKHELGIPLVVKPVNQQASAGVHVIFNEADYQQKILNNDAYQYAPLIVQRYIQGTDIGLDMLALDGKVAAIAIQQPIAPQRIGPKIKFFANDYLEKVAHILAKESGYDGVMNVDARIEDGTGQVFLFEANPRFWRTLSASVWGGLNFVAESIQSLQKKDEHIRKLTSGAADVYFHPLFRPNLWPAVVFDRSHRGRLLRIMMFDVYTFVISAKTLLLDTMQRQ
jgi:predicted ATP-grasp superfamily ATP-dependent carboligase